MQGKTDSTEPWYQTPYSMSNIDESWQEAWASAADGRLYLPEPNPFIPSIFDLTQVWREPQP